MGVAPEQLEALANLGAAHNMHDMARKGDKDEGGMGDTIERWHQSMQFRLRALTLYGFAVEHMAATGQIGNARQVLDSVVQCATEASSNAAEIMRLAAKQQADGGTDTAPTPGDNSGESPAT